MSLEEGKVNVFLASTFFSHFKLEDLAKD